MDYQSWIDQQEGVESRQQEISARQVKSAELEDFHAFACCLFASSGAETAIAAVAGALELANRAKRRMNVSSGGRESAVARCFR